ncbi:hypothetical protein [Spirosoma fluminis]
MQFEIDNLTDLLEPGEHNVVYTQFGLGADFNERMDKLNDAVTLHFGRLMSKLYGTHNPDQCTTSALLATTLGMVDQYVKPQTPAELVCTIYLVSMLVCHMEEAVAANIEMEQQRQLQQVKPLITTFHGGNSATA